MTYDQEMKQNALKALEAAEKAVSLCDLDFKYENVDKLKEMQNVLRDMRVTHEQVR